MTATHRVAAAARYLGHAERRNLRAAAINDRPTTAGTGADVFARAFELGGPAALPAGDARSPAIARSVAAAARRHPRARGAGARGARC